MSAVAQPSPQSAAKKEKILYYPGPSYLVGRMTYEEYLEFEPESGPRFELIDGRVYEMPGAKPDHNRIAGDAFRSLADEFDKSGLSGEVFGDGQKVYVNAKNALYPDVMPIVGEAEFDAQNALLNPALIGEVLSRSTGNYDRGRKFEKYQIIASLRHYLIIEQERVSVTHFEKIAGNLWAIVGIHNTLAESVTVTLGEAKIITPLTAIYRRVELPEGDVDTGPDETEEEE